MSLSILGGEARGLKLASPKSDITRPTSVLLKRRIFDANQDLSGFQFIDLFGGTGNVALEAVSRGASKTIVVEHDKTTLKVLEENIKRINERMNPCEITLSKNDAINWIQNNLNTFINNPSTIIFVDPPYEKKELYLNVLSVLRENKFEGLIWLESCRQKGVNINWVESQGLIIHKSYKQGTSFIAVCGFSIL